MPFRQQSGVITLVVTLVLLLLVTLVVSSDFRISTDNLRAVGNTQARQEALAVAQHVLAGVARESAAIDNFHREREHAMDLNLDETADYRVLVAKPRCVRAIPLAANSANSASLPGFPRTGMWQTLWEITATASEPGGGAAVRAVQALRYPMADAAKEKFCPGQL